MPIDYSQLGTLTITPFNDSIFGICVMEKLLNRSNRQLVCDVFVTVYYKVNPVICFRRAYATGFTRTTEFDGYVVGPACETVAFDFNKCLLAFRCQFNVIRFETPTWLRVRVVFQ